MVYVKALMYYCEPNVNVISTQQTGVLTINLCKTTLDLHLIIQRCQKYSKNQEWSLLQFWDTTGLAGFQRKFHPIIDHNPELQRKTGKTISKAKMLSPPVLEYYWTSWFLIGFVSILLDIIKLYYIIVSLSKAKMLSPPVLEYYWTSVQWSFTMASASHLN